MSKPIKTLSDEFIDRLNKLLDAWENGTLSPPVPDYDQFNVPIPTYIVKLKANLAKIVSLAPGSAPADVYRFNPATNNLVLHEKNFTVYNINNKTYNSGVLLHAVREPISGQYFVVRDDYVLPSGPTQINGNIFCCTSYASQKGDATVTACTETNLLPKYTVSFPRLDILRLQSIDSTSVPYTSINLYWISSCTFESDSMLYTDGGHYFWRLTVDRDPQQSVLELVFGDGSHGTGSGITGSGTSTQAITSLQYLNTWYWDSLGGTLFGLYTDRNSLPSNVATWFPCEVCVVPPMPQYINAPCLTLAADYFGRDLDTQPWPQNLYFEILGYTGTWDTQTFASGQLAWLVGDPDNGGNPDYVAWGKAPIDPGNTGAPYLTNKFTPGTITNGGTTGAVNFYPCVWCAHEYNIFYLQFHDGLPIGYCYPWVSFANAYYTLYFDDCSGGTSGDNYTLANTMPSLIDPSNLKVDFVVNYQLWLGTDPGNPTINGCTPRTISGTPPAWEFKVHVYEA